MIAVSAAAPSEAVLRATDIHLAFGGVMALGGVSFAVRPGEVF